MSAQVRNVLQTRSRSGIVEKYERFRLDQQAHGLLILAVLID